jgi:uncharacterized protein involved in exopolysaccharide biosynthesis
VFCSVFLLSAALSLTYVYTRTAEYRAVSRLQISPARIVGEGDEIRLPSLQDQPASFLTEVQVLTSRPLLQEALGRLKSDGALPDLGPDPVDAVQRMLHAEPVEQTQVVELSAEGPQQNFVWQLVNTVAAAYRDRVLDTYKQRTFGIYAEVKEEADNLHQQTVAKREIINKFREANDIVSLERDENSVLASIQNLSSSYATSNEALAKAQGRLQALRSESARDGAAISGKDDPTIAAIEQRASTLREQLTNLRRRYKSDYLALDADTKSLQERIDDLDQQLAAQRVVSQRAAVAAAQQEFATAQAAVSRLGRDMNENQKKAQEFATRLAEYKIMQEDLDHVQSMERATLDRLTKMQVSERERAPRVDLVELAAFSVTPWRPNYTQDAIIALIGSFALGLFAVWFNGYISGPAPARHVLAHDTATPQALTLSPHSRAVRSLTPPALERFFPAHSPRVTSDPGLVQLPSREPLPRELDNDEVAALMANTSDDVRWIAVALLSGLSPAEIVALRWDQIDFASATITVGGDAPRTLALEEPFAMLLDRQRPTATDAAATVLHDGYGGSLTTEELARLIFCAAYDAVLDRPQEVTPAALRHTYLACLLRRGIRAADIGRIAGHIPREDFVAYMQLTSSGSRLPLEQIDKVYPALRDLKG